MKKPPPSNSLRCRLLTHCTVTYAPLIHVMLYFEDLFLTEPLEILFGSPVSTNSDLSLFCIVKYVNWLFLCHCVFFALKKNVNVVVL